MDKKIIYIGMVIGSVVGGYLPTIFGIGAFSITSVFCGGLGGIIGIWLAWKISR